MIRLFLVFLFMANLVNATELNIHYNRLGTTDNWNLWVWNEEQKQPGFEIRPGGSDKFGMLFKLDIKANKLEKRRIGILPRRGQWEAKDNPERYFTENGNTDIYILEGDPEIYFAPPEISTKATGAWLDDNAVIRVSFSRPVPASYVRSLNIKVSDGGKNFDVSSMNPAVNPEAQEGPSAAWLFRFGSWKPSLDKAVEGKYTLEAGELGKTTVTAGSAVYGKDFFWNGRLGAVIENGKTVIRIFAPKAQSASVKLFEKETGAVSVAAMTKKEHGIWEKTYSQDLSGKYYRIVTVQNGRTYEGLDPYAECVTNDDGYAYIGEENTKVTASPSFDWSEAVVYEVHLRDLTISLNSGADFKGRYLGAAQSGTRHPKYPEITTGLDHIAELGVNVVHIMPFQDFQNNDNFDSYNWGYMPVNFNSPEGSYATDVFGPARVREAKKMIDAFHKKGIKVVMDVVYNHTAENRSEIHNFNAMSMDYYYRLNADGSYSNGSGCGNEFKTEAPMARKFIIDSMLHWMRDYKVDGFRFDLMGLIDLDTVDEIIKAVRKENPQVIIYGEPWTGGTTPITGVSKGSQRSKGYAVFNDNMRDAIKGSVFNDREKGYVQAGLNRDRVMTGIRGSIDDFADSPLEAINYVSCHDNHTLWDRIDRSAEASLQQKIKMDRLANAIVLTSQGVPFIHAGEEFLRTKKGEHNSYNLPDEINQLDWTRKHEYIDVFHYYKDLVTLRRTHPVFRMKTAADVKSNLKFYEELGLKAPGAGIAYTLDGTSAGDSWKNVAVLINPSKKAEKFPLPEGGWSTVFDENGFYKGDYRLIKKSVKVPPLSLMILKK